MKKCLQWFFLLVLISIFLPISSFSQAVYYEIWVKTGDVDRAGTDDDIYINLYNEFGEYYPPSGAILLDKPNYDDHERGQLDIHKIQVNLDFGPITRIKLIGKGKDNTKMMKDPKSPWREIPIFQDHDWYVEYVKVFYPAPKGVDKRYPIELAPMRNVTTFVFKGWISKKTGLEVTLDTTDTIGEIIQPSLEKGLRRIYVDCKAEVNSNFGTADMVFLGEDSFTSTDQIQYAQAEGVLTSQQFEASFSGKYFFAEASASLKRKIETSCQNYHATMNQTSYTEVRGFQYTLHPSEVGVFYTERYLNQQQGKVGYKEYGTSKLHEYTISLPITPTIDKDIYAFKCIRKTGTTCELEPVDPLTPIPQNVIDVLKGKGYTLPKPPPKIMPPKIKGTPYPMPKVQTKPVIIR